LTAGTCPARPGQRRTAPGPSCWDAAAELGAHHVKAGGSPRRQRPGLGTPSSPSSPCSASRRTRPGTPHRVRADGRWTNVRTLGRARRLIDEAGHPAGGLMIDLWHCARGLVAGYGEIAALPAPVRHRRGARRRRPRGHRHPDRGHVAPAPAPRPGRPGTSPASSARVAATGFPPGPWGVEVIADDFRQAAPWREQARRSHEAARAGPGPGRGGGPGHHPARRPARPRGPLRTGRA